MRYPHCGRVTVPFTAAVGGSHVGPGGKLGQWLPTARGGGLPGPFWVTQILEQNIRGGQQPWAVTIILHLLILPVFVIQEGFKIRGTYKFVLYVSQDCHLPCPTVSKAHGHQLLQERAGGSHCHIQGHLAQEELHLS